MRARASEKRAFFWQSVPQPPTRHREQTEVGGRRAVVQKRRHVVRIACLMKKRVPEGTLARGLH